MSAIIGEIDYVSRIHMTVLWYWWLFDCEYGSCSPIKCFPISRWFLGPRLKKNADMGCQRSERLPTSFMNGSLLTYFPSFYLTGQLTLQLGLSTKARNMCKISSLVPSRKPLTRKTDTIKSWAILQNLNFGMLKLTKTPFSSNVFL